MISFDVLDKGFVNLITHMGDDLLVVNAARVSFDKFHEVWEEGKDDGLIRYLASHNHWTPFGHPQVCLHMKAPIFIRTQLFKHKQGLVENEVSRRYVDSDPEFYTPDQWRGRPDASIKQGSGDLAGRKRSQLASYRLEDLYGECLYSYRRLVDELNIAPEMARMVLPQSTYTEWYWTGSLAAFARVFKQRSHETAQWEVHQYAKAISDIMSDLYPVSWEALTRSE